MSRTYILNKFYGIMYDGIGYKVLVTDIKRNGVKAKYVPFADFPWFELTGYFDYSKIEFMEEI